MAAHSHWHSMSCAGSAWRHTRVTLREPDAKRPVDCSRSCTSRVNGDQPIAGARHGADRDVRDADVAAQIGRVQRVVARHRLQHDGAGVARELDAVSSSARPSSSTVGSPTLRAWAPMNRTKPPCGGRNQIHPRRRRRARPGSVRARRIRWAGPRAAPTAPRAPDRSRRPAKSRSPPAPGASARSIAYSLGWFGRRAMVCRCARRCSRFSWRWPDAPPPKGPTPRLRCPPTWPRSPRTASMTPTP